ncbi:MAG: MotA/TolQ/ExbB proton channel family protein [Planctomycetota bacterium]|jgi:biopolymer transport protein ExbB/TolQ
MLEHLLDGGIIMIPLVLMSVLAIALIIDRSRAFRVADVDTNEMRRTVNDLLYEGKLDEAIRTCEASSGPVAAVMLAGLDKYRKLLVLKRPPAEIEITVSKTMEDFAPQALEGLENRLNLLTLVGSMSPLLGMTGTVTGMIKSFNTMAAAAGLDAGAVAGGISEALITTAAGLLIAMPAVAAYNIFTRKVDRYILEIDESITEVVDFVSLGHATGRD